MNECCKNEVKIATRDALITVADMCEQMALYTGIDCADAIRALIEHDAPSVPIEVEQSVRKALEAANIPDARKFIFNGLKACSNHSCIVSGKRTGMGTNGPCHCVTDLTRQQLNMLGNRLDYFLNALIPSTQAKESESK